MKRIKNSIKTIIKLIYLICFVAYAADAQNRDPYAMGMQAMEVGDYAEGLLPLAPPGIVRTY